MDLHRPRFFMKTVLLLLLLLFTACSRASSAESEVATIPAETPAETLAENPTAVAQVEPTATAPEDPAPEDPTSEASVPEDPATPVATESASTSENNSEDNEAQTGSRVFEIDPEQSEARFIVDELLFGEPNTVTGRTSEVTGQIEVDLADPTQTTISTIEINARSLATDNRFRNRSLNRLILQSNRDEFQFITFTPAEIEGLPAEATVGDTLTLQVTGDLKIREIVQPVTFEVTVTADSETQLTGLAQTTVQRSDFELKIPNVDGVADVTEEVRLELEFVAIASE